MAYTIQLHSESGNWSQPWGTDVEHADNLMEVYEIFSGWMEKNFIYSDAQDATALVWSERMKDVTDQYPDWQLTVGPCRGPP